MPAGPWGHDDGSDDRCYGTASLGPDEESGTTVRAPVTGPQFLLILQLNHRLLLLILNPPTSPPPLAISPLKCLPPIPQLMVCSLSCRHPTRLTPFISVSPTITTSQPSSPHELRHIISAGALTPPQKDSVRERKLSAHPSQHLGLRVGSRSPTSIPSSPTSV
jgi:hypothetical protein